MIFLNFVATDLQKVTNIIEKKEKL